MAHRIARRVLRADAGRLRQAYEPPEVPLVASLKSRNFITISDPHPVTDPAAAADDTSTAGAGTATITDGPTMPAADSDMSFGPVGVQAPGGGPPLPSVIRQPTLVPQQQSPPWLAAPGGYQAESLPPPSAAGPRGCWTPQAPFKTSRYLPPPVSTWYTRVDYFHWTERYHARNLLDEQGPLFTLGYTHQWGDMRVRAEIFGGDVQYTGAAQYPNGTTIPLTNRTIYYGGRAEYDFFCNLRNHPWIQLFFGLGIRCWDRDLPNSNAGGVPVQGYNETWFTFYPYIGFETRRDPTRAWEFYGRARIGVLAWNFNYAGGDMLYPRPGVTALLEEGVRIRNFTLTGWAETFGWARSGVHDGYLQPNSTMLTVGVKAGWTY